MPTLPPGSICSLPPLPGTLSLIDEGSGTVDNGVNDYTWSVFSGLSWGTGDPDHPITYLVFLVPDFYRLTLSDQISGHATLGPDPGVYWSAVDGVPVIAVPAVQGSGYSVRREKVSGIGSFRSWVYAYVGVDASDVPPAIHPDDVDTACNSVCGSDTTGIAPATSLVRSMTFDVPADDETATFPVAAGHAFDVSLTCPSGETPNLSLSLDTTASTAQLLNPPGAARVFSGPGGIASVVATDTQTSPTPYTCDLDSIDYGELDREMIVSVADVDLTGSCALDRSFRFGGNEQAMRILQPRGHGYWVTFTPLDGITLTVEAHDNKGSRDDFDVTTATPVRVAHNPSYQYLGLTLSSDAPTGRVQILVERGPIDEDQNLSSLFSVPTIALDTLTTAALFGVDNDRFRPTVMAGNIYEIEVVPQSAAYDIELNIEDPSNRVGPPAVLETGGAGVAERLRLLATSSGDFVVVVEDPGGLVTLQDPESYTVIVKDMGPET